MKSALVACLALLVCGVHVPALEGPESLRSSGGAAFQGLSSLRPGRVPVMTLDQRVRPPMPRPVAGRSRYIRLSGHLNLHGTAYVNPGTAYETVTVSGWTTLTDQQGRMFSGQVHFSETSSYYVAGGGWVSGYARPYSYVSLYRGGRYLGSVRVEGTIHVSGFVSGNFLSLNGSGTVSGSAWVPEDDPSHSP